ncbi:uncharacterized protein LOC119012467 isoform X2 [Acanthopagrus latus]|nr:uncharacterized protein LOC119012467 isoform X2 [Acanthopagrus latus]
MAGLIDNLMRLLLLSFIRTGKSSVNTISSCDLSLFFFFLILSFFFSGADGDGGLIFVGQSYRITFPCEKGLVCFHIWHLSAGETSTYIAIVIIGEIQRAESEDEGPECSMQIQDLTEEDVGRHRCQRRPDDFSPYMAPSAAPEVNLMPGKTVSLRCFLLGHCDTQLQPVSLVWVDETGAEIQEDSQHQVEKQDSCDITLTVTFQSPQDRRFRCQATAGDQVQTSEELRVRVPALKGRGRGLIIDLAPEDQDDSQDLSGAAVGVVACVVLAALVAAFVVNKRRTRNQLPDESSNTTSTNNVTSADDVIYADVILPVASDCVWTHESETTEYACIRY